MKKSRLFVTAYAVLVSILSTTPELTQAISLGDGSTHIIDYAVTDGLYISNATTVTLETGSNISGLANNPYYVIDVSYGTLNINDGLVQGDILADDRATVGITGGAINGLLFVFGGTATISGGAIDSLFSEAGAHLDITGGTFGDISTISGSYDITGGTFSGLLDIGYDLSATMDIKGGNFTGGFSYYGEPYGSPDANFIFYGDLSLTTPTLISGNTYETIISGTLMDGNAISQGITCNEILANNDDPCGRIAIVNTVPILPAIYLFGSGLLGLVGISRRKNAA